jgi:hypothetical protein
MTKGMPDEKVINAAQVLLDFTLDEISRAARDKDGNFSFYHPGKLADELRFFLDVFSPGPMKKHGA